MDNQADQDFDNLGDHKHYYELGNYKYLVTKKLSAYISYFSDIIEQKIIHNKEALVQ